MMGRKRLIFQKLVKNKQGFTVVEMVFAVWITLLTIGLLYHTLPFFRTYHTNLHDQTVLDIVRFRSQIERHLSEEMYVSDNGHRVITQGQHGMFYYEQYQHMIRRTSSRGGHEPLLLGVSSVTVNRHKGYVTFNIVMENDEVYDINVFISPKEKLVAG